MMGKIAVIGTLGVSLLAGISLYYLQVYAYYDEVEPIQEVRIHLAASTGESFEYVPVNAFQGIDSTSSPIRYRACFEIELDQRVMAETFSIYEQAEPLVAPNWFGCFDAEAIGDALENEQAVAFLGTENIQYGIDRVIAVFDDGRAVSWQQINECGEVVFDGDPAPDHCPTPPES